MNSPESAPLIVFAGGGTGGHLYPALAVADELRRTKPDFQFVFYGSQRAIDQKILSARNCTLVQQSLRPLSAKPWHWWGILASINRARQHCRKAFLGHRPLAVVGTGGLASVPAVLEAARMGIPTALINPDVIPGKANKFLAGRVDVVFAQFAESVAHLSRRARVAVTGCPVRPEFLSTRRENAIIRFELDPHRKTLLVTGASQGARTINDAVLANADFLADRVDWQVLHLTGEGDYERVRAAYQGTGVRAVVLTYTEHRSDALVAADLVVSRAGASTLAELTAVGRASILFPYPFHRDNHQAVNAASLVRANAAIMVKDERDAMTNGPALRGVLNSLLPDASRIAGMSAAARQLGHPQAATEMASTLLRLVEGNSAKATADSLQQSRSLAR